MADKEVVAKVHGKYHTYTVVAHSGVLGSTTYSVVREDGKSWGSYSSRAAAVRAAHEKAGPEAYES